MFTWCYSVPPRNAQWIFQDEYQPAFLLHFLIPCILLDISIDAEVIVHGKRLSLIKASKINKVGNVRIKQQWDAFVKPFLMWKNNEYYTFRECPFTALIFQHTMRILRIVMCGLNGPTLLFHIFPQTAQISTEYFVKLNMYFVLLCKVCLKHLPF